MRSRPKRKWDKENRTWIIPETELDNLLPILTGMEYKIEYSEAAETINTKAIPDTYVFKTNPFSYQKEGIEYGLAHPKFLLADEPGLGKTKQMLDLSSILKQQSGIKHTLIVVCANGLKYNWRNEVEKHTNETGYILGTRKKKNGQEYIGSNEDRLADIESLGINCDIDKHFYLITNIETLRFNKVVKVPYKRNKNGTQRFKKQTLFPIIDALKKQIKAGNISMIIVDEVHLCKNSRSLQGQALLDLDCQYKVALTGTPIMNRPTDVYVPLHWRGYEKRSYFSFEKQYCIKGGFGGHQIVGYKNLPEIQTALDKCMLRRLKSEVLDLPEKIYIDEYVEMSKDQDKLYDSVLNQLTENIDKIKLSPNPLTMLIRLRQVTGNPSLLSSEVKSNPKFDRMVEIVQEIADNGKKCVVFSNWTDIIIPAFELLQKEGFQPALYTGQNKGDREKEKQRFSDDKNCKVLLGTTASIGVGFTLTAASTVIFLDEPWSRATKDQCEDRTYRIGTVESPNIITIMCKGTIDEKIHDIVYKKGKMADVIIDREEDLTRNPNVLNYLLSKD